MLLVSGEGLPHACISSILYKGELKVDRRPVEAVDPSEYLPCKECNGFFLKHELSRHATSCISKKEGKYKPSLRQMKYEGKLMLAATTTENGCSPQLREAVISKMASDEITAVAETNFTILHLGRALLENGQRKGHRSVPKYATACANLVGMSKVERRQLGVNILHMHCKKL